MIAASIPTVVLGSGIMLVMAIPIGDNVTAANCVPVGRFGLSPVPSWPIAAAKMISAAVIADAFGSGLSATPDVKTNINPAWGCQRQQDRMLVRQGEFQKTPWHRLEKLVKDDQC